MYVLATERGSPADDAELYPGDMITRIDGEPVRSMEDVCAALDGAGPGASVEVDGVALASTTRIADIGEKFTVVVDIPAE
jgi:S1-C subfamily serine protease